MRFNQWSLGEDTQLIFDVGKVKTLDFLFDDKRFYQLN